MSIQLTSQTLQAAIDLSMESYEANPPTEFGESNSWKLVSKTQLGLGGIVDSILFKGNYLYDVVVPTTNIDAQAIVAVRGDTLAISFRGTDGLSDIITDFIGGLVSFEVFYLSFFRLFQGIDYYRANNSAINNILVTGHSLGGAMVEMFLDRHDSSYGNILGVTFGSPGIQAAVLGLPLSVDPRLFNFSHIGDPVHDATFLDGNQGREIAIDRPDYPDYNYVSSLAYHFLSTGDKAEHGLSVYESSMDAISRSGGWNTFVLLPTSYNISICLERSNTFSSTSGKDFYIGGNFNDSLYGGDSDDILDGGGQTDRLFGGIGDDNLWGGSGVDYVYGEDGVDYIKGEAGGDYLWGGIGNDTIFGDEETDYLHGEAGNDTLNGGSSGDILYGEADNDTLIGEGGNDTLYGGSEAGVDTGTDTAVFAYNAEFYRAIGQNALDFQIQATQFEEGTDRLIGIEMLRFKDGTMSVGQFLARFVTGTTTPTPIVEAPTDPDPVAPPPPAGTGLPKLYFSAQSFSEGNSGSRLVNVLVTLDKPAASAVTFFFTANGVAGVGAASAGTDFEAFYARTVTIAAGQSSIVIPVRIFGDTRVEGNEFFNGMVSNLSGAVLAQGGRVDLERMTIVNDDASVATPPPPPPAPPAGLVYLTLRQGSITLAEGPNGTETVFEFDVRKTGDMSVATRFELSVEGFGVAPATANDFVGGVFPTVVRTISVGEDRYSWQVRIQGDVTNEPNEYFKVMLDAVSSGVRVIEDTSIGVIINDDGTTPPPPGGGTIYVSVNALDAVKAEGTNVTFDPVDGTYSSVGYTIYTFEVTRSGDLSQSTSVKYRALTGQGGTPQSDSHDLLTSTLTLTFNPGEASRIIQIRVRPDNENEPNEAILVRISPDSTSPNVEIVRGTAQGTIINDDGENPPLITPVPMTVRETEGDQIVMFRVEIAHAMTVPVTMTYNIGYQATEDYVSVSGEDYLAATGTLTIPAGALFAEIPVTIRGDAIAEGLEAVMIRLSDPVNGYFGRSLDDWDSGIIVIDNDAADPFPTTGAEFEAKAIDLGVVGAYDFREVFSQVDAATPTHIYKITLESEQALMIFSDGDARPKFLFDSAGNLVHTEPSRFDEIEVMDLANGFARGTAFQPGVYYLVTEQGSAVPDGAGSFRLFGAPPAAEPPLVWIEGQDFSHIGPNGTQRFSEGEGGEGIGALVDINLSSPATTDVIVTLAYRAISATAGSDFNPLPAQIVTQVTIAAGKQSKLVSIDLGNDALFEGAEQFEVVIIGVVGGVLPNQATEHSVLITILDDETNPNQEFDLTTAHADRAEGSANGGTFTFTVTRPIAFSAEAATVSWNVLGSGAATASAADFAGGALPSGTLTFAAGESSRTITITAVGDRFAEADETFRVILSQPSAGFGIGIAEATGIIRNDDGFSNGSRLADGTLLIGTTYALAATDVDVILTGGAAGNLQGNALGNILSGNNAVNQLTGLGGDDSLFGYMGNDVLNGGTGADRMFGGDGNDTYFVDNVLDTTDESNGGGAGDIVYASVDFTASTGVERLYLTGAANISATGSDLQNDILTGNNGNNIIDGMADIDTMIGGDGNDTYFADVFNDVVTESNAVLATGGNDLVNFTGTSGSFTLGLNLERLTLGGVSAINGTGNTLANTLIGNGAANTLSGLGGNDVINSGLGIDTMLGGDGNDTFFADVFNDVATETNGVLATGGNDLVNFSGTTGTFTLGLNVERLTLGGVSAINGTGNALGNTLIGNAGVNILNGGGGVDQLYGYGGNDSYYVDSALDAVFEAVGGGIDRVFASVSYTLAAGQNIEILSTTNPFGLGAINLTGNTLNNTVIGNAGVNILNGGGGVDQLYGYGGNDSCYVDNALDAVFEAVGGGIDRVYASVSYTLAAGQNIEILSTTNPFGLGAINLTGNTLNNTVIGNAGVNILNGGGGVDQLYGYGGNDSCYVDNALDAVFEAVGGGIDRVFASVSYTLAAGQEIEILATNNQAGLGAINLTGNAFNNTIVGNNGANVLNGSAGNDVLSGFGGADTFVFNTALNAATNRDTITDYNSAADTIRLENTGAGLFNTLALGVLNALFFKANATGTATDADDRIIYNTVTGALFYDSNGSALGGATQFATLNTHPVINSADFVVV